MNITEVRSLRMVVLHEGESYVVQCLEHDIAAQGRTADEAWTSFLRTLAGQVLVDHMDGKIPLSGIGPAPTVYKDALFASGLEPY